MTFHKKFGLPPPIKPISSFVRPHPKSRLGYSPRHTLRLVRGRNPLRPTLRPALRPARRPSQLPGRQLRATLFRPALRLLYSRRRPRRISYIRRQLEPIGRILSYLKLNLRLRKKAWRAAQKEKRLATQKNPLFASSFP